MSNLGEHGGTMMGNNDTTRPTGGNEREHTPLGVFPMFPPASPRDLAEVIFAVGKLPRETLLAEFTSYVSANFDEAEFARSFATVHKVFHDWMDQ